MKHPELRRLQEAAGVAENILLVIPLEISRNIISIITSILVLIILRVIFPTRYTPNLSISIWDLT
jgi:hypothetical protein